ncbi:MAG TPA: phosphate ABC transporter substrate-binding protein [Lachnospiraceae bacterium]|jgi:phosphate transport system substrate-binding protein|nr:phosphate ABC transporter substrate-binding protein [Lachnospiraceae bacterium]HCM12192.1 phosphate ABC transporter substrate-binding protein [Lachnospiraceae bacterium]HCR41143.1 phosphate ABC transporter substrate-binding protein [Lachnospiraceae bacterium]
MKKKRKGFISLLFLCVLFTGVISACSSDQGEKKDTNQNTASKTNDSSDTTDKTGAEDNTVKDLRGAITMSGSTSMEKLANVVGEVFMVKYPGVTVSTEFIGSSAGIEAVVAGTVDIGNASRNLKDTEKEAGAVENIVAIDGIAVIVDKKNAVTNLTKDQLVQIYKGEINNWNKVGGADQPIVVVGRESGSGTRGAFEEILKIEDMAVYADEINSTGGVMAKVASTAGAIGYVSLDVLDDSVTAVQLEGVEATPENIKAGNYFLSRPFVMATKGEISEQNELVQAFFEYISSEEGKTLIESVGLIPAD